MTTDGVRGKCRCQNLLLQSHTQYFLRLPQSTCPNLQDHLWTASFPGPSQIPPLSLIPHRIKATSPPTYLQPHCLLTSSLTSMLTSKLTSNKISMLISKLTSSQSLLIRLRRKITSPTLKFSSCLLFPVKSNRAWEKNMVRKEGRNIQSSYCSDLHTPVSHLTDEEPEAQGR